MKTEEEKTSARTIFVVVTGCFLVAALAGQMGSDNAAYSSRAYAQPVGDSTEDGRSVHGEYERSGNVSIKAFVAKGSNGLKRSGGAGSLSTGFEPGDGFLVGAISGQAGWAALQPSPEGHIDSANPATGSQHLRISKDPSLPTLTDTGALSPDLGPLATGPSTTSVDVAIGGIGGADYTVAGQSTSEGFVTWQVYFRVDGQIRVLDDIGNGFALIDTGAAWNGGPYQNLTVCDDPVGGTTTYYYNGQAIYCQVTHLSGSRVEQVVLLSDNFHLFEHGDFDNLSIQTGLSGVCGVCASPPSLPGIVDGIDHDIRKHRFLSINANNPGAMTRMRLSLLDNGCSVTGKQCSSDGECTACDAGSANAGDPCDKDSQCSGGSCVVSGETCEEQSPPVLFGFILDPEISTGSDAPPNTVIAAVHRSVDPGFRVWDEPLVHVTGCQVAPGRVYRVELEDIGTPGLFAGLDMRTSPKPVDKDWGDIVGHFTGTEWTAGNFLVDVNDVSAMIKFLTLKPAPHITVVELLGGRCPLYVNMNANVSELGQIIGCFKGQVFPSARMVGDGYPDLTGTVHGGESKTLLDCNLDVDGEGTPCRD